MNELNDQAFLETLLKELKLGLAGCIACYTIQALYFVKLYCCPASICAEESTRQIQDNAGT